MTQSLLENRFMEFCLGKQRFALPLIAVKEVISKPEITPLPNMPAYFEGMLNLRGKIIGVVNLRKKIGVESPTDKPEREVIIVVEIAGKNIGMIVDEVSRVIHASSEMIKDAPIRRDDQAAKYIKSVIHDGEDIVLAVEIGLLLVAELNNDEQKVA